MSRRNFVQAANPLLLCLQSVEISGIRSASASFFSLLLHVNDESLITQNHQGAVSQRRPDVVLVSELAARGTEGDIYTTEDIFLRLLPSSPINPSDGAMSAPLGSLIR